MAIDISKYKNAIVLHHPLLAHKITLEFSLKKYLFWKVMKLLDI